MKVISLPAAVLLLLASFGPAVAGNDNRAKDNNRRSECMDLLPNTPWRLIPKKCQIELGSSAQGQVNPDESRVGAIVLKHRRPLPFWWWQ